MYFPSGRLPRSALSLRRISSTLPRPPGKPPGTVAPRQTRRFSHRAPLSSGQTPDFNSGFTGSYDPTVEGGRGPMFNKANFGVPQYYPRDLKKRVDEYVVGQERAKKTICSTIFNHYQNLRRRSQHEEEERDRQDRLLRQRFARDREAHQRRRMLSLTDGEPMPPLPEPSMPGPDSGMDSIYRAEDLNPPGHVQIGKSNLLLLGPTGVGKTYILETLSKKIQVPFAICDCNTLTQAGYVGQDVESCIERLLVEANYDIKAAERGIVVLDEFDKIARAADTSVGRDVGGEGVQQALLKLVEGTQVTVHVRDSRSSKAPPPSSPNYQPQSAGASPSFTQGMFPSSCGMGQYTIDTTNIMFVFCGAFVGLDKAVTRRVAKPAMGFGGEVLGRSGQSGVQAQLPPEAYSHLAHYNESTASSFTPLDLVESQDLQQFGFIPELIGRLHNICALSPLSKNDLYRILTEPRNSLVAQYTALFETYPSRLQFTEKALRAVAERAAASHTGARGLKWEMERILAEPMFDAPTPYVLITEACVKGIEKASYWGRDGRFELDRRLEEEQITPTPLRQDASYERSEAAGVC